MSGLRLITSCWVLCSISVIGCAPGLNQARQSAADAQVMGQLSDLNSRLRQFDADNNELHTQVAGLQQQLTVSQEEKQLLREQLADATRRLQQTQIASQETNQRLNALQASSRMQGATITANNSLTRKLEVVEVTGLEVQPDGDVIRIVLPLDRVFESGTTRLNQLGLTYVDQVAAAIRRHYPRQHVVVEGHYDSQSLGNMSYSLHQLTATHALAVLNQLVSAGLSEKQLYSMGCGANEPKFSNGDAAGQAKNRRVEVVIYPETYDAQ